MCGFLVDGSPKPAVENDKKHLRKYSLAKTDNPPATEFVNVSGKAFNTIHANNFKFFKEVNVLVQEEPFESFSFELMGMAAAIGIVKDKLFNSQPWFEKMWPPGEIKPVK